MDTLVTLGDCNKACSSFSKISFGGVSGPSASRTLSRKNFRGCMENVLYNDMNIVHLAQEGRHVSITVGSQYSPANT